MLSLKKTPPETGSWEKSCLNPTLSLVRFSLKSVGLVWLHC